MKRYVHLRNDGNFGWDVDAMKGHSYKETFGVGSGSTFGVGSGSTFFLFSKKTGEPLTLGGSGRWCFIEGECETMTAGEKAWYKALRQLWKAKHKGEHKDDILQGLDFGCNQEIVRALVKRILKKMEVKVC